MRRSVLKYGLMALMALPGGDLAAAPAVPDSGGGPEVFLAVRGGARLLPLVLAPFARDAADVEMEEVAAVVLRTLEADLRNAVRFEVAVDSSRADGDWQGVLEQWSAAGARALVRGEFRRREGRLELSASLYRLPDRRVLLARTYGTERGRAREAAHRLNDDIVLSLSGQRGVASTRIAFVSSWEGRKEVYIMDYDGQAPRPLTQDRSIALSPAWSPDGRRIVYTSLQPGRWELRLADLHSGAIAPVRTASNMASAPCWSPDGQRLLFARHDHNNVDLYSVAVNGGGLQLQRITDHPEVDTEPSWSPDGTQIAFTSDRTGLPQIYIARADGSEARRLTWEPDAYEGSARWSPDGRRIAFVRRGFEGFEVYVAEVAGGEPVRLTSGGSNENPSWSPDGLQLVFSCSRDGRSDICATNWDGSNWRRLTAGGGNLLPTWSPWFSE